MVYDDISMMVNTICCLVYNFMVFFLLVCSWESFTTPAKDWKMPLDRRWWACQCAGTSKSTKMNSWFLVSNFSILCDWEMCSWAWKPERECTRLRACMCWFRSCFCCQKGNPLLLAQKSWHAEELIESKLVEKDEMLHPTPVSAEDQPEPESLLTRQTYWEILCKGKSHIFLLRVALLCCTWTPQYQQQPKD